MYYAHSSDSVDKDDWHPLSEHLRQTGELAAGFLNKLEHEDWGLAAGLLHDLGKYTAGFQKRLEGGSRVDHATAGAQEAVTRYGGRLGKLIAFCVAGHHVGLANGASGSPGMSSLADRLTKVLDPLDPIWRNEVALPELPLPKLRFRNRDTVGFCFAFFVRMLFSALVDADFLDTESYFKSASDQETLRGGHPDVRVLAKRLARHLEGLEERSRHGELNALRSEILRHVHGQATRPRGIYSLTVPTGGGKTLTSLDFALNHAVHHDLDRVIYVIPFMNIVEQTSAVFREALRESGGAPFVVEHHSNFDESRIENREAKDKLRLAMENWDGPVIVTTAVQFFESLFANRTTSCRKLHNIANSVVILDEAQTLPLRLLMPCVTALDELSRNWATTVVLCTATQPALGDLVLPGGFQDVAELAPRPKRLYRALKRTRIVHKGEMNDDSLAARIRDAHQVLCIVNTRRHARELYLSLINLEGQHHLTTLMCPRHRSAVLRKVRQHLHDDEPVRLIATSLVEAGVDIDFPVVWRAEAGLDSIVQAAGRCNRENRVESGDVHVFRPAPGPGRRPPPDVGQFADVARWIMEHFEDPASLGAIDAYFRRLYKVKGGPDALDTKRILNRFRERASSLDFEFKTISDDFRLIETHTTPIIVPYPCQDTSDLDSILASLHGASSAGSVARRLQPYLVQVPPLALGALRAVGAAEPIEGKRFGDQFIKLSNENLYDDEVGLSWDDPTLRHPDGLIC